MKIVSCFAGAIYDVIVDLRPGSPTYRKWQAFELTAENQRQLYIPAGFAHGFQTLTEGAGVSYLISNFYEPSASTGVSYDDPAFGIRLAVACCSDLGSRPDLGLARRLVMPDGGLLTGPRAARPPRGALPLR